jgi:hypothetical protein
MENSLPSQIQRSAEVALAEKDAQIKLLSDRACRNAGEADQWRTLAQTSEKKIKELEAELVGFKAERDGAAG